MSPADGTGQEGRQEADTGRRCKGVKASGEPCGAPPKLVDPETGYCPSHGPDAADKLAEYGRKGGETTARRHHGKGELVDEDLPPLVDHEAAETWTDRIGRAAATGKLSSSAAQAALRAVREWREARDAGRVSDRLEALTDALAEWRETGDPEPVLELVDGGES